MAANGRLPDSALSPVPGGGRMRKDAALRFNAHNYARRRRGLSTISVNGSLSGYRSYAGQVLMRRQWCARGNCANAAIPGTSNHGLGIAADVNNPSGMQATGPPFGFDKRTSDAPWEPWHFKWNGRGGTNVGPPAFVVLRHRSTGTRVKHLQRKLRDKGFTSVPGHGDDGYGFYGDSTVDAVRRFQRAHHLTVDGKVGRATARALDW